MHWIGLQTGSAGGEPGEKFPDTPTPTHRDGAKFMLHVLFGLLLTQLSLAYEVRIRIPDNVSGGLLDLRIHARDLLTESTCHHRNLLPTTPS